MDVRPIDLPPPTGSLLGAPAGHPGVAREHVGHVSYEFELTGAHSVFEALAWAEANAGPNRTFTLYVATIGRSLIRLAGADPTANPGPVEG